MGYYQNVMCDPCVTHALGTSQAIILSSVTHNQPIGYYPFGHERPFSDRRQVPNVTGDPWATHGQIKTNVVGHTKLAGSSSWVVHGPMLRVRSPWLAHGSPMSPW